MRKKTRDRIEMLEREVERLQHLVADTRDVWRLFYGKGEIHQYSAAYKTYASLWGYPMAGPRLVELFELEDECESS